MTDRLIPKMDTFADIEELFEGMQAEIRYQNNNMEIVKIFQELEEAEKVTIRVYVDELDEEVDCLRFKLIEGNPIRFVCMLNEFDEQVLSE